MVVFERFLGLVNIFDVFDGVFSLDDVRWLHARSWLAVDQALCGELGLLNLSEVLFLLLILFLGFLNFGLRFGDLALCFELFRQLLVNFILYIGKSLLSFGGEVLHLLFADGALRSLSSQRLKFLHLKLCFFHLRKKLFGFALCFERLKLILTNILFSLDCLVLDFADGHILD